jgi:hypothetical protein
MKDTHTPLSSLRIPPELKAAAQAKAATQGRTLTDVVVTSLREYVGRERLSTEGRMMIAEFVLVRHAVAFRDRLTEKGRSASPAEAWSYVPGSLHQTGRTVTWEWSGQGWSEHPDGSRAALRQYLADMLGTVGAHGSAPQGRKATLNGVRAPAEY